MKNLALTGLLLAAGCNSVSMDQYRADTGALGRELAKTEKKLSDTERKLHSERKMESGEAGRTYGPKTQRFNNAHVIEAGYGPDRTTYLGDVRVEDGPKGTKVTHYIIGPGHGWKTPTGGEVFVPGERWNTKVKTGITNAVNEAVSETLAE